MPKLKKRKRGLRISLGDLKYLHSELLQSADSKLDIDLPESEGPDRDPLRGKVSEHVEKYLLDSFKLLNSVLLIDGYDQIDEEALEHKLRDENQEMEPYDRKLGRQLRQVLAKAEAGVQEVTLLRKTAALKIKEQYLLRAEESNKELKQTLENVKELPENIPTLDQEELAFIATTERDFSELVQRIPALHKKLTTSKLEVNNVQETINYLVG